MTKNQGDTRNDVDPHSVKPKSALSDKVHILGQVDEKEIITMVVNTINGGLKGSNDDDNFSYFYVNDGLCRMLGYTKEEFMTASKGNAVDACYEPDLQPALACIADWFSRGPEYKAEYRMRKKDGSLIWVLDSGRKFVDSDGKTRINSIITDITAERVALEELNLERERYNFALEIIDSILFEFFADTDTLVSFARDEDDSTVRKVVQKNFRKGLIDGKLIDPADAESMIAICDGSSKGPVDLRICDFVHPKRGLRYVTVRAKPMYNSDNTLHCVIGVLHDITDQKQGENRLHRETSFDRLTGILNYVNGRDEVEVMLADPSVNGALFIIDIDDFKRYNSQFGHVFANAVLINVADKLRRMCLSSDILARIGGDEFFMFLKDIGQIDAIIKGGRLLEGIQSVETGEQDASLSCSIGIAVTDGNLRSFDKLFAAADKALSWAKSNGKSCVELFQIGQNYSESLNNSCDRFVDDQNSLTGELGERQLINFALDIFDKTNNVQSAVRILIGVLGRSFNLDRITVHQMGASDSVWTDEKTQPFPCENWSVLLPKADLYTLVEGQDSSGTIIVQGSNLDAFSPASHLLITQNHAATVLYAPIFGSGQHIGAVSFVSVNSPRVWTTGERSLLGEISRIMAARVVASRAVANVEKRLETVVNYDSITGLVNFGRFKEEVERAVRQNPDKNYVLYYIDIQQFKFINEKLGYAEGDNILKDFSSFVRTHSKRIVSITRAMADHFVILIEVATLTEDFGIAANKMHDLFRDEENKKYDVNIMFRTGIYLIDDRALDVSLCIDRANSARKAIHHSQGSASIVYSPEIGRRLQFEHELTSKMESALKNNEFCVYFQPKVRLSDYKIVGAEALVRWQKPDGTVISPISFIPLFEKNGFITKLDRYVVAKTIEQMSIWKNKGLEILPISVNASALHAKERDYALYLLDLLRRYDIDPSLAEVELTESAIVDNSIEVENMLTEIRSIGVKTSIDDLGSGYSVLNMIMNMPIDVIKIDREFITNCCSSKRGIQFLEQLISMIKNLGYTVLCEGIETMEQAKALSDIGCDLAQGYIFGRPMPIQRFEALLKATNR